MEVMCAIQLTHLQTDHDNTSMSMSNIGKMKEEMVCTHHFREAASSDDPPCMNQAIQKSSLDVQ